MLFQGAFRKEVQFPYNLIPQADLPETGLPSSHVVLPFFLNHTFTTPSPNLPHTKKKNRAAARLSPTLTPVGLNKSSLVSD